MSYQPIEAADHGKLVVTGSRSTGGLNVPRL